MRKGAIRDTAKLAVVVAGRIALRVFYVFPIKKNYILFATHEGRQYSCNPKYLYLYIKEHFGDKYKYVWVLNKLDGDAPSEKCVRFLSLAHLYYLLTCRFIISNLNIEPMVPKRKGQVFVNTWHGGGAYKIGVLTGTLAKDRFATLYKRNIWAYRERKTDLYLSSCKAFTDFTAVDWRVDIHKFLPTGMPRNDFLLKSLSAEERAELRKEILKKAGLEEGVSYILYAPTFRGSKPKNHDLKLPEELDVDKLIKVCRERFGKDFKVLYREHLGCTADADSKYSRPDVVGISFYPDMQELLFIADILITDYSSSMWDFALLRRPGFLYVPDLEEYKENTGFFTPIDTWAFPYATSNAGLQELIAEYDEEKAMQKIEEHLARLGSYERGNACEQVVSKLGL